MRDCDMMYLQLGLQADGVLRPSPGVIRALFRGEVRDAERTHDTVGMIAVSCVRFLLGGVT